MLGWEECNSSVSENILKASLLCLLSVWMLVRAESFQRSYQLHIIIVKRLNQIPAEISSRGVCCGVVSPPTSHLARYQTPQHATNLHRNYKQVLSHQPFLSLSSIISSVLFRPASCGLVLVTSHPTSDGSQMEKILLI